MTEYELNLLGFYRERVREGWALLELATRFMPEMEKRATLDHLAKCKSLTAKVERLREEQMIPGFDDLTDYTGQAGCE